MLIEPNTRIMPGPSTGSPAGDTMAVGWRGTYRHARWRQTAAVCRSKLGRFDRPDPGRIHQDPEQIAGLRSGLGGAWLYGGRGPDVRRLGARAARRPARRDPRNRPAAR